MENNSPDDARRYGYARVSTEEQDLSLQLRALEDAGVWSIYHDKASGKSMEREGLERLKRVLRRGDTIVIWKLDRLGRSVKGLLNWLDWMNGEGIGLEVLTEQIDTKTPSGRMVTTVLAALAQMERELTAERTRSGMEAKKAAGHVFGRRHSIQGFPERIRAMAPYIESGAVMTMHPGEALAVLNAAHDHLPKAKRPAPIKSTETFRRWRRDGFPGYASSDELTGK